MKKFNVGQLYGHKNGICCYCGFVDWPKDIPFLPPFNERLHLLQFLDGEIMTPDRTIELVEVRLHRQTKMLYDPYTSLAEKAEKIMKETVKSQLRLGGY